MMDEESDQSNDQFSEIVHASLFDVDGRPLRLKILDWVLVIVMILALGLFVGILFGACAWVWLAVVQKF